MKRWFIGLCLSLSLMMGVVTPVFAFQAFDENGNTTKEYQDAIDEAARLSEETGEPYIVNEATGKVEKVEDPVVVDLENIWEAVADFKYKVTQGDVVEEVSGDKFSAYYNLSFKLPDVKNKYGVVEKDYLLEVSVSDGYIDDNSIYSGTSDFSNSTKILCRFLNESGNVIHVLTSHDVSYDIPVDTSWWHSAGEDDLKYDNEMLKDYGVKLNFKVSNLPAKATKPFNVTFKSNLNGKFVFDEDTDMGKGKSFSVKISSNGTYSYAFYADNGATKYGTLEIDSFEDPYDNYTDPNDVVAQNVNLVWDLDENGHDVSKYVDEVGNPSDIPIGNGLNEDIVGDFNEDQRLVQTGYYVEYLGVFVLVGFIGFVLYFIMKIRSRVNNEK